MSPLLTIETERLKLIALSQQQLILLRDDFAQLEANLDLPFDNEVVTDLVHRAISMKIERMALVDPADHIWFTYWMIVIPDQDIGVGLIGFKGTPDTIGRYDNIGEVEIGYGISPNHEGHGYTTESAKALINWAFSHETCKTVIAARVLKTNIASQRILDKLGMTRYDENLKEYFYHIHRRHP